MLKNHKAFIKIFHKGTSLERNYSLIVLWVVDNNFKHSSIFFSFLTMNFEQISIILTTLWKLTINLFTKLEIIFWRQMYRLKTNRKCISDEQKGGVRCPKAGQDICYFGLDRFFSYKYLKILCRDIGKNMSRINSNLLKAALPKLDASSISSMILNGNPNGIVSFWTQNYNLCVAGKIIRFQMLNIILISFRFTERCLSFRYCLWGSIQTFTNNGKRKIFCISRRLSYKKSIHI